MASAISSFLTLLGINIGSQNSVHSGQMTSSLCFEKLDDVVGIFPNEASIIRLIGAVLFEQNDEWQTASRYMQVEAFAQSDQEETDPILSISNQAA